MEAKHYFPGYPKLKTEKGVWREVARRLLVWRKGNWCGSTIVVSYHTLNFPRSSLTYLMCRAACRVRLYLLEKIIDELFAHPKAHGYCMRLRRSKPDGKDSIKTKYYYECDKEGS